MFNLGLSEIILISIIALIFIGPKQLPEIARAIGRALNELKRASEDLTTSITNPKSYEQPRQNQTPAAPTQPSEGSTIQELHSDSQQPTSEIASEVVVPNSDKKDEGSST